MNALNVNKNARFQPPKYACEDLNICYQTLMRLATEANAVVRFGKSTRIDMPALYSYIENACKI